MTKSKGKEKILCRDYDGTEFLIPIGYTSMSKKDGFLDQTENSCDFRYDDLVELLEIIKKINAK